MSDDATDFQDDEALSALVDGELSPSERAAALDRLARDPRARAQWARLHAQRAALREERVDRLSPGFVGRVSAAVAEEPAIMVPRRRWLPRVRGWRRLGGAAVAATAAVVTVAVLVGQGRDDAAPTAGEGGATPAVVDEGVTPVALDGGAEAGVSAAARRRMGQYLSRHAEAAGVSGLPGVVPFTRLSGFNARQ